MGGRQTGDPSYLLDAVGTRLHDGFAADGGPILHDSITLQPRSFFPP